MRETPGRSILHFFSTNITHHRNVNANANDIQAFQNFIDARIQPEAGDLDVVFFDACIAAKRNRSMLHVTKKSDAAFLR